MAPPVPSIVSRTARNVGPIKVPLYLAPWSIPVPSVGGARPWFDTASRFPVIQIPDAYLLNYGPFSFRALFVTPVSSWITSLRGGSSAGGSYVSNYAPTFLDNWFSYILGTRSGYPVPTTNVDLLTVMQTLYGLNVNLPSTPGYIESQPFGNLGGTLTQSKPFIFGYGGFEWFATFESVLSVWNVELWSPMTGNKLYLGDFFQPTGINPGTSYKIAGAIPTDAQNVTSYLYSIKGTFYAFDTIYYPPGNVLYHITLDDATLDTLYQTSSPNNLVNSGQQFVSIVPRGWLLMYNNPRTFNGRTQAQTCIILSPSGDEYAELIFVPETPLVEGFVSYSGGAGDGWSVTIDPFGVLYLTNGYDRTKAAISYAFNIPFQSPVISWPAITPFSMPCYNPCAAIPIGV